MKLEERMPQRIQLQEGSIVLLADISELGSPAQVSRALKVLLLDRGKLVRIGTGIYAKARRSSITGAVIPADSLETLTAEALERLGVQLQPGEASKDYNAGTVAVTGVCAFLHATTNSPR